MNDRTAPAAPGADAWLRRLSHVSVLSAAAQATAQRAFSAIRRAPTRDHLVRDGIRESAVKVLIAGFACRYKYLPAGRRQITAFILPGDICDFGFLSGSPAAQDVVALAPSLVASIELDRLAVMVEEQPDIMTAILRCAAIEQSATQELLVSLGARNALQRVAHLLCELHFRMGLAGLVRSGDTFELPLTQAELGEALGLSTVHVNRTVQSLRKMELAVWRDRLITLPDLPRLAALCAFEPAYLKVQE
ncbi:Crp/Fnr family transcriptional regulator [Devosia salina]|uniref:Crp/Fnr family transcriptional regulator n=1 Tax=Devosia salina TaxID=2860336 RepID=A0ABX8WF41_9HYPH|nr:Crp/Fnr family transcriptional regulator [Devosia salina]QYO76082.1 Crp/Fnr family transcriptional regulator [Devosia salina]